MVEHLARIPNEIRAHTAALAPRADNNDGGHCFHGTHARAHPRLDKRPGESKRWLRCPCSLRRCVVARIGDQHTLRGLSGCASWRAFYIRHNDEPSLGSTRPSFGVA